MLLHISVIHFCSGFIWWTQSVKKQQFLSILINLSINFFLKNKISLPPNWCQISSKGWTISRKNVFWLCKSPSSCNEWPSVILRPELQVSSHPGGRFAPGHSHHQPARASSDHTRRVWRLLCQRPARGSASRHRRRADRCIWGASFLFSSKSLIHLQYLTALSVCFNSCTNLENCQTPPCPPSKTPSMWLTSAGTPLTHTSWLWVSFHWPFKMTI